MPAKDGLTMESRREGSLLARSDLSGTGNGMPTRQYHCTGAIQRGLGLVSWLQVHTGTTSTPVPAP